MTDETNSKILEEFAEKLINSQKPLDAEFAKILDDNFWDLLTEVKKETNIK